MLLTAAPPRQTRINRTIRPTVFRAFGSIPTVAFVAVLAFQVPARATTITLDGLQTTTNYSTTITGTLDIELGVFVNYLVVGGGGGGGNRFHAGGGGGGSVQAGSSQVTNTPLAFTIGAGGTPTNNGGSSIAFGITATGGGGGGYDNIAGKAGSSGGGGGFAAGANGGGAGTLGEGFAGGAGISPGDPNGRAGGGGGGAGQIGAAATAFNGGKGGDGITSSISGTALLYGGGGGGAAGSTGGAGGAGGGGSGSSGSGLAGSGTNGRGGGGGGANNTNPGGSGGSGTVIVSYPSTSLATSITNGTTTNYSVSGTTWTVHTFSTEGNASLTLDTTNPAKLFTNNFGTLDGTGALAFRGPGTLNFVAPNSYSGGTTVHAGTLGIVSQFSGGTWVSGSVGSGGLQIEPGATFRVGTLGGGTTSLPSSVSGTGLLSINAGSTVLLGTNMASFGGDVLVQGGTVRLASGSALGTTGGVTRLDWTGGSPVELDLGGQAIVAETLRIGTGSGDSTTLAVTNSQATAGSWAGPIVLDCLSFRVESSAGPVVLSGEISGTGAIFKRGSGNLTISGSQPTNLRLFAEGGTLTLDGDIGSGQADLTCSPGRVAGTGTIRGSAAFFDGTHAPGGADSAGIQTIIGTLDYRRVALEWSLFGNTTAGRGINYDGVDVIGTFRANQPFEVNTVNVSFDSLGSTVDWTDQFWDTDRSWTMIDVTGTSNLASSFSVPTASYLDSNGVGLLAARPTSGFVVTNSGGDLTLTYLVAVPEPSTLTMAVVGLACGGYLLRRVRKYASRRL